MARRYDHSREELHKMILDETARQIAESGVRSVSARKIAREIGYSVGTLYNFFVDFDDLIMHVNAQTMNALQVTLKDVDVSSASTPEEQLQQLADMYISFTRSNFHLWNCVFEYRLLKGKERPSWYHEKIERLLHLIQNIIDPLYGTDGKSKVLASAWLLWCSFHGICTLANMEHNDDAAIESARKLTGDLIINYLRGIRNQP
jgi:AcrR family transcriptional regulator